MYVAHQRSDFLLTNFLLILLIYDPFTNDFLLHLTFNFTGYAKFELKNSNLVV